MADRNNVLWDQIKVLATANIKSRYRKTVSGFIWVILNPLIMYGAQSLVFSKFLKLNVPNYGLFLLSGLLPWIFISQTLEMCVGIYVNSSQLLKAFSVHPLVYLSAQILDNVINFIAAFILILIPVWIYAPSNALGLLLLPIPLAILIIGVWSLAWLLATLQVFLRDTKFVLSFAIAVAFFLTPVFYPVEFVPPGFRWLVVINPFHYLINPFRVSIYSLELGAFALETAKAAFVSLLLFAAAQWYWNRKKNYVYINL